VKCRKCSLAVYSNECSACLTQQQVYTSGRGHLLRRSDVVQWVPLPLSSSSSSLWLLLLLLGDVISQLTSTTRRLTNADTGRRLHFMTHSRSLTNGWRTNFFWGGGEFQVLKIFRVSYTTRTKKTGHEIIYDWRRTSYTPFSLPCRFLWITAVFLSRLIGYGTHIWSLLIWTTNWKFKTWKFEVFVGKGICFSTNFPALVWQRGWAVINYHVVRYWPFGQFWPRPGDVFPIGRRT